MRGSSPHTIVSVGEPLPEQVLDTAVDPTEIVQQSFDTERRGFDQQQVQQYLRAVADSLQDAQQREADMRSRLGRAVRRAETAENALRNAPAHDPAELNREFGDQVSSVLEAARAAGNQRVAAAEQSAKKVTANAKAAATTMRAEADSILQDRHAAAESAATEIVSDSQAEAQLIREQARVDADAMLTQAADRVQRASDECDGLISEAEEARAQILEDMERRRRQARAQVERLRVGRDRLLRSYDVVRRTLEETTVDLKSSLKEAKVRGDGAARAVASEPLASRDQLEAELRDAKMIGRITISDPAPASSEDSAVVGPLRSTALPRALKARQQRDPDTASSTSVLQVSEAMSKGALAVQPKAPAIAPALKASAVADASEDPIAVMMAAAEAKQAGIAAPVSVDLKDRNSEDPTDSGADADALDADAPDSELGQIDAEFAELEDDNLNVVEPSDEIEEVVAVPLTEAEPDAAAPGLFAALRVQRSDRKSLGRSATKKSGSKKSGLEKPGLEKPGSQAAMTDQVASQQATDLAPTELLAAVDDDHGNLSASVATIPGIEAQRDAVIAHAAMQLEKRLKRALADEQNDVLAGIRAAKKKVALTAIVGDVDTHINRYVLAIHEVAAVTYGAGAALIDAQAAEGHLPAGAVEELLETDVVLPIRQALASLDDLGVDAADMHVDPVRAFYRQRKTDHLGLAASRLANLLCVAGLCDALPEESPIPWAITAK
jgi:cell division septum initiation protein DivIVA